MDNLSGQIIRDMRKPSKWGFVNIIRLDGKEKQVAVTEVKRPKNIDIENLLDIVVDLISQIQAPEKIWLMLRLELEKIKAKQKL